MPVVNMDKKIDDIVKDLNTFHCVSNINICVNKTPTISFDIEIDLPPRGRSFGVNPIERVELELKNSPLKAPKIKLRSDFPQDNAHIQPRYFPEDDCIEPCIIDEKLDEFYSYNGLKAVIDRLITWLSDAAWGNLRNLDEFWETARRDTNLGSFVVNYEKLSQGISKKSGKKLGYCKIGLNHSRQPQGWICDDFKNNIKATVSYAKEHDYGITIFFWPDNKSIKSNTISQNIMNLSELKTLANEMGCVNLWQSLNDLANELHKQSIKEIDLTIIFAIKRPQKVGILEGNAENFELISYFCRGKVEQLKGSTLCSFQLATECTPITLIDTLKTSLQEALSGYSYNTSKKCFIVGAGSLGSKIAVHLAKSGFSHLTICDNGYLRPHNNIRMGYISPYRMIGKKADILASQLKGLEITVKTTDIDFLNFVKNEKIELPNNENYLIDTTASQLIYNTLCLYPLKSGQVTLIHCCFYSLGRVAVIAKLSPTSLSSLHDLIAQFWSFWATQDTDSYKKYWSSSSMENIEIGQGCSSLTMAMSDAKSSILAAGIAEYLSTLLSTQENNQEDHLYIAKSDGMSVIWDKVVPSKVIPVECNNGWQVSLLNKAHNQIKEEAEKWGDLETGGYILGFVNKITKQICITDLIKAPEKDTIREETMFILGIDQADQEIRSYNDKSLGNIQPLGTWHSHPKGGGESQQDKQTLKELILDMKGEPACMLIWRPEGYKIIIGEA